MSIPGDEQWRILSAKAAEVVPEEEFRAKLGLGRPLRVKLGCDPTAEHVHLGWAVVLRQLRRFQDLGHIAVLIVGDFTARIGDPSGQDRTRPMLSKDQVDGFAKRLLGQFELVLDLARLEVRYNSEWLEPLSTQGLLELASHYTIAQMLQRDDFAERYTSGTPVTVREFLYPLLQAYDSVAVEADVEIGGTDQHFNLMVGRHIQRAYGQEPQAVLTMPLLEGTDGVKKMSQSLGNYVAITEEPAEMFGKLMRVPDELLGKYLLLAADLAPEEVDKITAQVASGGLRPEQAKRHLAEEVVAIYHGPHQARAARERFDLIFTSHEIPEDVPEVEVPEDCRNGVLVHLPKFLKAAGLAPSTTQARRLVDQAGVRLEGETLSEEEVAYERLRGRVVQVGKRRFIRVR